MFGALGRRAAGLGVLPGSPGGFVPLVGAGWLHPAITFARASAAALLRSTDGALVEVGNNVPRFDPDLGLLITGQRQSFITNSRWEGTLPGAPGTLPSNSGTFIAPTGITRQVIGVVTTNGIPEFQLRFSGTPNSGGEISFYPPVAGYVAVSPGNLVTAGVRARIAGGSLANVAGTSIRVLEYLGGSYVREGGTATNLTSVQQPFQRVHTVGASVDNVLIVYSLNGVAGQPLDITIGWALPDIALAPFAAPYSPILPPINTPGVTTRLADNLTAPLASLGIPASGACTIVGTFVLPQLASSLAQQFLLQIEQDGNNRIFVRNTAGTNTVTLQRVTGGAFAEISTPVVVAANTPIKIALSNDGAGRASLSVDGSSVRAVSGVAPNFWLLNPGSYGTSNSLNGYIRRISYLPRPTADADLPALSLRSMADLTSMREIIEWP